MSPRAASCFSATWRSRTGSPSSSSRSFSPYRLPSPRVRFVLSQTQREKQMFTSAQHWTGSEVHTRIRGKQRGEGAGREQEGGRRTPVVVDLLLDLWHGRLLSLTESRAHILTASQAQVCDGGGYIGLGPPSLLAPCGPEGKLVSVPPLTTTSEAWTYQVSPQLRTGILMSKPQGQNHFQGVPHSLSGETLKLLSGCVQTLCSDTQRKLPRSSVFPQGPRPSWQR